MNYTSRTYLSNRQLREWEQCRGWSLSVGRSRWPGRRNRAADQSPGPGKRCHSPPRPPSRPPRYWGSSRSPPSARSPMGGKAGGERRKRREEEKRDVFVTISMHAAPTVYIQVYIWARRCCSNVQCPFMDSVYLDLLFMWSIYCSTHIVVGWLASLVSQARPLCSGPISYLKLHHKIDQFQNLCSYTYCTATSHNWGQWLLEIVQSIKTSVSQL